MQLIPPIHHIGYAVEDLEAGIARFAATFGAGPFFVMEHIEFQTVTYNGEPAVYDHSSGFGQWGPILVELTQVHAAQPEGLERALAGPGSGIGHVAWLVDDLDAETARLQASGLKPFHTGQTGPASAVWFDGGDQLGHNVEVLQRRDEILGFYALVRAAAQDWGGTDPYRLMTGPPE
jgi:catechol 2,3-dioxygenase-like lactoylglutathione lyase family enzyme